MLSCQANRLEVVAFLEGIFSDFFQRTGESYLFYPRTTETSFSDFLQLTSFGKRDLPQLPAIIKGIRPNFPNTGWYLHALYFCGGEQGIPDYTEAIWNSDLFVFALSPEGQFYSPLLGHDLKYLRMWYQKFYDMMLVIFLYIRRVQFTILEGIFLNFH